MRDMGTVDIGSPRAVGRGLPVATVHISPCDTREAMLQLFCSNLVMVHYMYTLHWHFGWDS